MECSARNPDSPPGVHVRWAEGLLAVLVLALLVEGLSGGAAPPAPDREDLVHRVDLNRASWHELTNLPGIGEVRARRIVTDRRRRGAYEDPEELERVHGIGPGTVEKVRGQVDGEDRWKSR